MELDNKKVIRAWAFFDWANSSYSLVISTAIFPIYYIAVAPDRLYILGLEVSNSALYSFSISFAYILIAIIAPILGGMADYGNRRLYFLRLFTTLGSAACLCLFFFHSAVMVWLGTIAFIISTIGFAGSLIFYDAFLPSIASVENYDKVSAKGYAFGYFGSVLLLIVILAMSQQPQWFGLPEESSLPYRIGFVLVALWWFGFAQYSFKYLPKDPDQSTKFHLLKNGYKELQSVIRDLRPQTDLKKYLLSFFFYSAGVQTVIYLATVFAEKELNFDSSELIMTVLLLQLVAIIGAYLFADIARRRGTRPAILSMILIWMAICFSAYFVETKITFFVLAFFVGLVLGGIQSSSRAGYSKLIPGQEKDLNSYFSFYDLLYYLSIVFGTFAFGAIDNITGNLRYSVLMLAVFFVIAFLVLWTVKIPRTAVE